MSQKWKYADIDAETRLERLRGGDTELFDEEIARTKEVIKANEAAGIDTQAQRKWLDKVGYNYNLHMAKNAGESLDKVSKTGYARLYLDPRPDRVVENGRIKISSLPARDTAEFAAIGEGVDRINEIASREKQALREKYEEIKRQARDRLYSQYKYTEEALVNSGNSLLGGKARKKQAQLEEVLSAVYSRYDGELEEALSEIDKRYQGLSDSFINEVKGGTADRIRSYAGSLTKSLAAEAGVSLEGALPVPEISEEDFGILYNFLGEDEKKRVDAAAPRNNEVKLREIAKILYERGVSSPEEIGEDTEDDLKDAIIKLISLYGRKS